MAFPYEGSLHEQWRYLAASYRRSAALATLRGETEQAACWEKLAVETLEFLEPPPPRPLFARSRLDVSIGKWMREHMHG